MFGNGVGVVLLKRLDDALADGDHDLRRHQAASRVNNDGATKVGFTAPSVDGQAEVIAAGPGAGGRRPRRRSATSRPTAPRTPLGDPIEFAGADPGVPGEDGGEDGFCALGSVKRNVGHLDTAAGVSGPDQGGAGAGPRAAPAEPAFEAPNPKIDFADSPFYVNTR